MRPTEYTLKTLVELVSRLIISEKTIMLYLYYCTCNTKTPRRKEIQAGTGLALETIRTHDKVLEALGIIKKSKDAHRGNGSTIEVSNLQRGTTPPSSSYTSITSILDIPSQRYMGQQLYAGTSSSLSSASASNTSNIEGRGGCSRFNVRQIEVDEDYQTIEKILLKFFKPFEVEPKPLTKKNRFSILIELFYETNFDFERYCKWYAENKYPDKGFNFGLFLYSRMVAEYKYRVESGNYHKTKTSLANSESFKHGVEKTKDFLDGLGDV